MGLVSIVGFEDNSDDTKASFIRYLNDAGFRYEVERICNSIIKDSGDVYSEFEGKILVRIIAYTLHLSGWNA